MSHKRSPKGQKLRNAKDRERYLRTKQYLDQKGEPMLFKLYAIRDSKAEFYESAFPQHTHAEAQRTFASLARDTNHRIGKNPEDYDLYYLGEYDNIAGKIFPIQSPEHLVKATALLN